MVLRYKALDIFHEKSYFTAVIRRKKIGGFFGNQLSLREGEDDEIF